MASELVDVLRRLLGDPPIAAALPDHLTDDADPAGWWAHHQRAVAPYTTTVGRAFGAGFAMDRLGYAFASGYTEALAHLVPTLAGTKSALCATERGGGHPRAMETRLEPVEDRFRLVGEKSFVTLGEHADELLVVACVGVDDHERKKLQVVRIPRARDGVRLEARPPTPFVPEVPHATVLFEGARVERDEILEGDGFEEYVKPFRTVEDLHVMASVLGWLAQVARRGHASRELLEDLAGLATSTFALALVEPLDAATHVALGGLWRRFQALVASVPWDAVDPTTRSRFERDRPLLQIASDVREQRLDIAWGRLGRLSMVPESP
ncbi:MAG: acyl-CoA dehydrogenase family protein [Myxococcales bacterium]|nr:acyl-CoA dehydrogenase family protein [Myxococcales bacterium]